MQFMALQVHSPRGSIAGGLEVPLIPHVLQSIHFPHSLRFRTNLIQLSKSSPEPQQQLSTRGGFKPPHDTTHCIMPANDECSCE